MKDSLSHIEWNKVDAKQYRLLIPVWENYFLYLLGNFSGLPQFERYHFVDYKRSIKRGIGICGDASMVLSQLLDKKGVENNIVSYRGHVITEAIFKDNSSMLLDPDFGVILGMNLQDLNDSPASAYSAYIEAGYSEREALKLVRIYSTQYTLFDDTYEFMCKLYIFEYLSYILKWLLPAIFIFLAYKLSYKQQKMPSKH